MLYQLDNLTKKYGNKTVLEIPHLEIQSGNIRAIVGPNGAGKTTFLNILAFLDMPSSGKITYQDEIVFPGQPDLAPFRRQVTLVTQDPLIFSTSVYENVAYGLRKRGIDNNLIKERVTEVLRLFGLSGFESRRARTLSGGESKRLAIARALAIEPEVLVLDEPTANIDKQHREMIENIILQISQKLKTTIVFSTLDMYQAYRLATSITSLIEGKTVEASTENLFKGSVIKQGNLKWMEISTDLRIYVEAPPGGQRTIWIDPKDIIISHRPFESSARNTLKGKIIQTTLIGNLVRITINPVRSHFKNETSRDNTEITSPSDTESSGRTCNGVNVGVEIVVIITQTSYQELNLALGNEVYLTFKASAVRVL